MILTTRVLKEVIDAHWGLGYNYETPVEIIREIDGESHYCDIVEIHTAKNSAAERELRIIVK